MTSNLTKTKAITKGKSWKDLLNTELADNLDIDPNCKLTKIVKHQNL